MAVKRLHLECDWCEEAADQYEDDYDAVLDGWYLLLAPPTITEGDDVRLDELAYCSAECLVSDQQR